MLVRVMFLEFGAYLVLQADQDQLGLRLLLEEGERAGNGN